MSGGETSVDPPHIDAEVRTLSEKKVMGTEYCAGTTGGRRLSLFDRG
jgi:hypothetical protein